MPRLKEEPLLIFFFSADDKRPRKLEEEGLTHPGGIFVYAYGSLVLVRKKGSPLPLDLKLLKKRKGPFPLMAIANPKTAPFGEAGLETLKSHGLYERMESEGKLIRGENAGKAFYYVSSGHVDLGLVSKSFVLDPQKSSLIGGFSEVPPSHYEGIRQTAVVLKGKMNQNVEAFLLFLNSKKARSIIKKMGYGLPPRKGPTS